MLSVAKLISWMITCSYPLNSERDGSWSLGYFSISSRSILIVAFLLRLLCFFGVFRSFSDECWLLNPLELALMSGFPCSPFNRLFSSFNR